MVPQDMVRHLTACLVLGLEALHSCDVLYRALSPELVFLDSRYARWCRELLAVMIY